MNQLNISKELKKKVLEKAMSENMAEKKRNREAGEETPQIMLRGHHMLCMQLFRGEGYSDGFSRGMTHVIQRIRRNPAISLQLVKRPDEICSNCPNLMMGDQCSLSNQDVVEKDSGVFEVLGLGEGVEEAAITYEEAYRLMKQNITEEAFLKICGNCRWREAGLCSWELLKQSF